LEEKLSKEHKESEEKQKKLDREEKAKADLKK